MSINDLLEQGIGIQGQYDIEVWDNEKEEYTNFTSGQYFEFDRDEMVVQRIKLDNARERFLNSRVRVTFDEAVSMAEKALAEETYGTEIGMVGEKEYKKLEKALSEYSAEWAYLVEHYFKAKCDYLGYCPETYPCPKGKVLQNKNS